MPNTKIGFLSIGKLEKVYEGIGIFKRTHWSVSTEKGGGADFSNRIIAGSVSQSIKKKIPLSLRKQSD